MPQTLDGVHVLLVEDDDDSREVMRLIMQYQGALVLAASSAKLALNLMNALKPDVLVTDISMPGEDGLWLLEEGRKRGILEDVPVLAVTALPKDRVQNARFDGFLRKPVDPNALCTTVQALARGRRPPSHPKGH